MTNIQDDMPFAIEEWSATGNYVRDIARSGNLLVARAAFHEAVRLYPKLHIRLRNRALLIEEHHSS